MRPKHPVGRDPDAEQLARLVRGKEVGKAYALARELEGKNREVEGERATVWLEDYLENIHGVAGRDALTSHAERLERNLQAARDLGNVLYGDQCIGFLGKLYEISETYTRKDPMPEIDTQLCAGMYHVYRELFEHFQDTDSIHRNAIAHAVRKVAQDGKIRRYIIDQNATVNVVERLSKRVNDLFSETVNRGHGR